MEKNTKKHKKQEILTITIQIVLNIILILLNVNFFI